MIIGSIKTGVIWYFLCTNYLLAAATTRMSLVLWILHRYCLLPKAQPVCRLSNMK